MVTVLPTKIFANTPLGKISSLMKNLPPYVYYNQRDALSYGEWYRWVVTGTLFATPTGSFPKTYTCNFSRVLLLCFLCLFVMLSVRWSYLNIGGDISCIYTMPSRLGKLCPNPTWMEHHFISTHSLHIEGSVLPHNYPVTTVKYDNKCFTSARDILLTVLNWRTFI